MIKQIKSWEKYSVYFLELKKKLTLVMVLFLVGALLGVIFCQDILSSIIHWYNFSGVNLVMTSPGQVFEIATYSGILFGCILASPVLIYELFCFIRPALTKTEQKLTITLLPIIIFLFFIGAAFGIWMSQSLITLYSNVSMGFKVNNIWDVQKFFSLLSIMAILCGFIFQMPVILTWLMRLKVVNRKTLANNRKYVYAALVIITVLMPPPDLLSDLIIFLPMAILFEGTMLFNLGQK
jgi:sec-independent protein translocase protein TatC